MYILCISYWQDDYDEDEEEDEEEEAGHDEL